MNKFLTLMAQKTSNESIEDPVDTTFLTTFLEKVTSVDLWINIGSRVLWSIAFIIIGVILIKILNKIIENFFLRKAITKIKPNGSTKRNKTLVNVLQNTTTIFVWFVIIVTILETFNIPVGTLLAGAGVAGLAIGFGAQSLVKDMITGFFIILENQFDTGDFVQVNLDGSRVAEGQVVYLGLRSSRILGNNSEVYMIPNGTIGEIVNFSKENSVGFIDIYLPLTEDISRVERILNIFFETNWQSEEYLIEPPQVLGVEDFVSGQVQLRIQIVTKPMEHFHGMRVYRRIIKETLEDNGIELAIPAVEFGKEENNN